MSSLRLEVQSVEQESIDLRLHAQSLASDHADKIALLAAEKRREIEILMEESLASMDEVKRQAHAALLEERKMLAQRDAKIGQIQDESEVLRKRLRELQDNIQMNESNYEQEINHLQGEISRATSTIA